MHCPHPDTTGTADEARDLLQTYKDLDLDFGLDPATLPQLLKGDTDWAALVIQSFESGNGGVINALSFITGVAFCAKTTPLECAELLFDAFDFDETQLISFDEMVIALISAARGVVVVTGQGQEPEDSVIESMVADAFSKLGKSNADQIERKEFTDWMLGVLDNETIGVLESMVQFRLLEAAAAPEAAKRKAGKNPEWDSGGEASGDPKDSDDFAYLTYPSCPKFTPKHRSLMAKHCTEEMFAKLKDVTTDTGYTFHNAIQTGTETPHLGVGLTAGDEDSYDKFKDIIYPIIAGWHGGYDAATQKHPTDLNPENVKFDADQQAKFDEYVVSTRIRAARNIRGFPLPPGATRESAAGVEGVLKKTFAGLDGDLKGTYYPLAGMDAATESDLQAQGFLFQKPKTTNLLTNAGAARYWPESRGIFHNDNKTALCWCNEEDHCRIISMAMKGNVKDVFARFCSLSDAMKASAVASGADLMHSENLGFIGSCPSNLGTGLRASVMIKLEKLNENVELLEKVCESFDLQPRGSAGEHSAAVGGKWDVSNKQRIGFSEVQLVQKMIDGVSKLIGIEERLASGATAEDIEKSLSEPAPEAAKPKAGKNPEWDSGGEASGDPKDSDDFAYLTYPSCPKFTPKHRSLMAKHCTEEMFAKLKDVTTDTGYTFHNAIQTGTETPHLGVGLTAGDEDSYDKFKDIIYPIIAGWHGGYDAATQKHPTDLNPENVKFDADQQAKFDEYVVSTRIRAARNIRGFPLPPGATRESAAGVEGVLKKTFAGLDGDLKGTYYPLAGMDAATESDLQAQGFLFQKPKTTNLLTNAGAARYWPESRGIFHNDNKTALCWCNEEDHCRIISMAMKGNVKDVFARFCSLSDAMKASAVASGADLMHSENLGFIGSCPSNLGTGLRASVMIKLEKLNENVELLEKVCESFDLQPRGSAGEHSAAVGGKWDVSNKQRIGFSEVQLVQKMIDGVSKLIGIEERLASGATAEEIEASLQD